MSSNNISRMRPVSIATVSIATASIAAMLLAGCGSSTGSGSTGASANTSAGAPGTAQVGGVGTVLVDNAGRTLYFADAERTGKIKCTGGCLRFWLPADSTGATGSSSTGSMAGFGTLRRPDTGHDQLTYHGAPLYTFAEDGGPGQAKGNGASDSFGGITFSWHAVVLSGGSTGSSTSTSTPGTSTGGGYGGY